LGLAWNVSNRAAFVGQPTRYSETVAEAYWNFVFFKFVQIGPDLGSQPRQRAEHTAA